MEQLLRGPPRSPRLPRPPRGGSGASNSASHRRAPENLGFARSSASLDFNDAHGPGEPALGAQSQLAMERLPRGRQDRQGCQDRQERRAKRRTRHHTAELAESSGVRAFKRSGEIATTRTVPDGLPGQRAQSEDSDGPLLRGPQRSPTVPRPPKRKVTVEPVPNLRSSRRFELNALKRSERLQSRCNREHW